MRTLSNDSELSEVLAAIGDCFGDFADLGRPVVFDESQATTVSRCMAVLASRACDLERRAGPMNGGVTASREFPPGVVDLLAFLGGAEGGAS